MTALAAASGLLLVGCGGGDESVDEVRVDVVDAAEGIAEVAASGLAYNDYQGGHLQVSIGRTDFSSDSVPDLAATVATSGGAEISCSDDMHGFRGRWDGQQSRTIFYFDCESPLPLEGIDRVTVHPA